MMTHHEDDPDCICGKCRAHDDRQAALILLAIVERGGLSDEEVLALNYAASQLIAR